MSTDIPAKGHARLFVIADQALTTAHLCVFRPLTLAAGTMHLLAGLEIPFVFSPQPQAGREFPGIVKFRLRP